MIFEFDKFGLICVPIVVQHSKKIHLNALIDTGSASTVFDINHFDIDLFDPNSEVIKVIGIGGCQEEIIQQVEWILIDNNKILDFKAHFGDITDTFGFDAIIGADLLKQLNAVIDYKYKKIIFS